MHVTLVADYGWWPLSDPLITFVKYCCKNEVSCSVVAVPVLDFIDETFPPEPEFSKIPIIVANEIQDIEVCVSNDHVLRGDDDKHIVIYFGEQSLVASCESVAKFASQIYLYSTEIPETTSAMYCSLKPLYEKYNIRLIIQDERRLKLFENTFSVKASDPCILPNSNLKSCNYDMAKPRDIQFPEGKKVIIFTGSLIHEHCAFEMTDMFIRSDADCFLFINGWGNEVISDLKLLAQEEKNIVLSTKLLSGAEIRWIYSQCYAGIVSYSDKTDNHKYCGMSAGKLFWLCRYGKPTICNDNFSISKIVECNNLGVKAVDSFDFEYLEKNYHNMSESCRKFYNSSATRAEQVLKQIVD